MPAKHNAYEATDVCSSTHLCGFLFELRTENVCQHVIPVKHLVSVFSSVCLRVCARRCIIYTHTRLCPCKHAYMHTHLHTHIHIQIIQIIQIIYIHVYIYIYIYIYRDHTHAHTYMHTYIHKHDFRHRE